MPTKGTSVKGIRLPDDLWDLIDREADAMEMTRNRFLATRLRRSFSHASVVGNSDKLALGSDRDGIDLFEETE